MLYENYIVLTDLWTWEAVSAPQRGRGWMHRWGHHSHSLLPFPPCPWLIESVQPKLTQKRYQFTSQALQVLTSVLLSFHLRFFHFCLGFHCILTFDCICCVISTCGQESSCYHDGPGRIQCLCSSSTDIPKWGLYGATEQKCVGHIAHLALIRH